MFVLHHCRIRIIIHYFVVCCYLNNLVLFFSFSSRLPDENEISFSDLFLKFCNLVILVVANVHCTPQLYHVLYGNTSCCISKWPVQRKRVNFDPLHISETALQVLITRMRTISRRPPTTWMVSANTQFATVTFLSLSFFLHFA